MKKISLLIMLFGYGLTSYTQPTISAAQYAINLGEFQYQTKYLSDAAANPGDAGASVTWNFATMTGDTSLTTTVGLCPGESICDEFPTATQFSMTSTGNSYTLYKKDNSSYEIVGSSNGVDPYFHNSNTEIVAKFPITYNQTFTDYYATNNVAALVKGRVVTSVDGYGTVITPVGTYTNVLRIKRIKTDTTIIGATTGVVEAITYEWVKPGMPTIAAMMKGQIIAPVPQVTQSVFAYTPLPDNPTSVNDVNNLEKLISVYPNPAINDPIQIKISDCKLNSLKMMNIRGGVVYNKEINVQGQGIYQIPVQSLAAGLYMVIINTDKGMLLKKITIAK